VAARKSLYSKDNPVSTWSSKSVVNVAEYRERAKRYLPRSVFDYVDGGAEDESCLRRNRECFSRVQLIPKIFKDVSRRDLSTRVFGSEIAAPILIAPTGLNGMVRMDGDLLLARAAAKANIPFVLSTASGNSIEQVAETVGGNLWFQLYLVNREMASHLMNRAAAAGYKVLLVTVDTVVSGQRERDLRNRFSVPLAGMNVFSREAVSHPWWFWNQIRRKQSLFANLPDQSMVAALAARHLDATISWDDLKLLRDKWPGHLVVKGAMGLEDLKRCESIGVDGIALSNHGGRQLDSAPTPLDMLFGYRSETSIPLLVDGGVRRGADIVKALALGAASVLVGRAFLYGLAVAGEAGVSRVVDILKNEMDRTCALIGCCSVAELDSSYLFDREAIQRNKTFRIGRTGFLFREEYSSG
jgi:(S)-mandelate dehydrogenase